MSKKAMPMTEATRNQIKANRLSFLTSMAMTVANGPVENNTAKKPMGPRHFSKPSTIANTEIARKSDRSPNWNGLGAASGLVIAMRRRVRLILGRTSSPNQVRRPSPRLQLELAVIAAALKVKLRPSSGCPTSGIYSLSTRLELGRHHALLGQPVAEVAAWEWAVNHQVIEVASTLPCPE